MFSALRTLPLRARPAVARTFATTPRVFAGHKAAALLGEGAKPGEVPTDENQATGLERLELLGKMEGVDVFDMNPLEMTRIGTLEDPIKIYSSLSAMSGALATRPTRMTPSGSPLPIARRTTAAPSVDPVVYALDFHGDPHAHEHH
ncbi:COX5B domain-containing protein [Rhizoctonia solani AG-1 IA]|uniref:COX5B domain-containing protein n=1 Tax=Thanatephorus cucumeris (strain AG1-IA) TaxID=983506 RepID=L8WM35_THACA|nr:COX5B domain-containing protein [Rhizoctonia solani AG-1 IA]